MTTTHLLYKHIKETNPQLRIEKDHNTIYIAKAKANTGSPWVEYTSQAPWIELLWGPRLAPYNYPMTTSWGKQFSWCLTFHNLTKAAPSHSCDPYSWVPDGLGKIQQDLPDLQDPSFFNALDTIITEWVKW